MGNEDTNAGKSVELFEINENGLTKCNLEIPDHPELFNRATVVLLNDQVPVVAGGQSSDKIFFLSPSDRSWVELSKTLSLERPSASGITLGNNKIMILGGSAEVERRSYDIITLNIEEDPASVSIQSSNDFPDPSRGFKQGCFVKINDTTALAFGGGVSKNFLTKSYFFNIPEEKWITEIPGPELLEKPGRNGASCGLIEDLTVPDKKYIIMAGGFNSQLNKEPYFLDSNYYQDTDIWEVGTGSWAVGPEMPVALAHGGSAVSLDGKNLYVTGGQIQGDTLDTITKLSCNNGIDNCQWETITGVNLEVDRYRHVAAFVPDTAFPCSLP